MRKSLTIIACLLFLPACGQKGPLFLPQEALPTQQEINQATDSHRDAETATQFHHRPTKQV